MNIKYQYHYITSLLKRYGFRGLVFKTLERSQSPMLRYSSCYQHYLPTEEELTQQRKVTFSFAPLVSIVIPTYETPEQYLRELLDTLQAQTYANWELCLADGSSSDLVKGVALEYAREDVRIRYHRLEKNGGISENTNGGFAMARGEYIALMDHDDLLTENALFEMVKCLNEQFGEQERKLAMIYSDEDKINGDGTVYSRPHFKPDYNPEFLRHNNYFCHFLMFSAELLKRVGGLNREYDGAQDYDFVLRCVEEDAVVRHIPKILYHWRIHEGSTAGNSADKAYAFDNGCRAIEGHLARVGEPGTAAVTTNLGVYKVEYELNGCPKVTVVAEEQQTLAKIREHYKDTSFQLQYMLAEQLNNGVEQECMGDYILFIQKGIKVSPENLIEKFLGICQHPKVGIVGAKILTAKQKVASCGVTYKADGTMIPLCGGIPAEYKGYFLHGVIPKNVSVVPFACVMLKREAWDCVKGDSDDFTGIYRDADYCFKLSEQDYQVIVTPEVVAVQKIKSVEDSESVVLEEKMREAFLDCWKERLSQPDPCYNCNLSQQAYHTYAMRE